MNYRNYTAEDFLNDKEFVNWVLNPEEGSSQIWKNYLDENHDTTAQLELAKKIIHSLKVEEEVVSEETIKGYLDQLKQSNHISEDLSAESETKLIKLKAGSWMKWAVAAVIIFAVGIKLYFDKYNKPANEMVETAGEWIIKSNPRGQKIIISFDEGSTVKLNAESTLKYSTNFRNSRIVELEGEAFFEVKRDPEHPFIVKSKNFQTTVLGTSFNVRSYADEQRSSVAVATGIVSVSTIDGAEEVFLNPSQMVNYSSSSGLDEVKSVDLATQIGWKNNVLVFENADFDIIEKELGRWYNVKFEYDKKPIITSFNGDFKNQSLENILNGIGFSTGLKYRLENQKVIILN